MRTLNENCSAYTRELNRAVTTDGRDVTDYQHRFLAPGIEVCTGAWALNALATAVHRIITWTISTY